MTEFLAPYAKPFPKQGREKQHSKFARHTWQTLCGHVDPAIRRGLRFYKDSAVDPLTNCGAVVSVLVAYTGDSGEMGQPATITATPRSALTRGKTSIVTVTMHYHAREGDTLPPPPGTATIKVLVVKRDGRWWIATPLAFNPLYARSGGFSESALRLQHAKMLADAK